MQRSATLIFLTLGMTATLWASPDGGNDIGKTVSMRWKDCLRQPAGWYAGEQAVEIADNVLFYQHHIGGWDKNIDMARPLSADEKETLRREKFLARATIDNGATTTQMRYLARIYQATGHDRFREAFIKGVDYLLEAQYPNGGWPQFYPLRRGYVRHITYNDNAMIKVMTLIMNVVEHKADVNFVDEPRRIRCQDAITRGLDILLKTQVRVNGQLTVWCAQHDEVTLEPAPARSFEPVSLSGHESVEIVRYLIKLENPTPEVKQAIEAACAWFEAAKITGKRLTIRPAPNTERGFDRVLIDDPEAGFLWARFNEIGTNKPMFMDRDRVLRESFSELTDERRNGYSYLGNYAGGLLKRDYPAWKAKWRE